MKLLRSFYYAWSGIVYCGKTQPNFRIHLGVLAAVIVSGVFFKLSKTEWLSIIVCSILVLVFEMINTAIEYLCDLVTTEFHPGIKTIKDLSAGAVLICAAGTVLTGLIIFIPKIIAFLK